MSAAAWVDGIDAEASEKLLVERPPAGGAEHDGIAGVADGRNIRHLAVVLVAGGLEQQPAEQPRLADRVARAALLAREVIRTPDQNFSLAEKPGAAD